MYNKKGMKRRYTFTLIGDIIGSLFSEVNLLIPD